MTKYDQYLEAKRDRMTAEEWNNLPYGPKYRNDTFEIALMQCSVKLTRCGQKTHAGQNYWEIEKVFGQAIAEVIKEDHTIIYRAIKKLKEKEVAALKECEKFANDLLYKIREEQ